MDDCEGGGEVRRLQVLVEGPELSYKEHSLVDDRAAGKGDDVCPELGLLELTAEHVEAAVKLKAPGRVLRPCDEAVHDDRHAVACPLAEHPGADGNLAPAQEVQPFLPAQRLDHPHGLCPEQFVLWEEEHSHTVVTLSAERYSARLRRFLEEGVAYLGEDSHPVAGLAARVLARPVLQLLHDAEGVVHD